MCAGTLTWVFSIWSFFEFEGCGGVYIESLKVGGNIPREFGRYSCMTVISSL